MHKNVNKNSKFLSPHFIEFILWVILCGANGKMSAPNLILTDLGFLLENVYEKLYDLVVCCGKTRVGDKTTINIENRMMFAMKGAQ